MALRSSTESYCSSTRVYVDVVCISSLKVTHSSQRAHRVALLTLCAGEARHHQLLRRALLSLLRGMTRRPRSSHFYPQLRALCLVRAIMSRLGAAGGRNEISGVQRRKQKTYVLKMRFWINHYSLLSGFLRTVLTRSVTVLTIHIHTSNDYYSFECVTSASRHSAMALASVRFSTSWQPATSSATLLIGEE